MARKKKARQELPAITRYPLKVDTAPGAGTLIYGVREAKSSEGVDIAAHFLPEQGQVCFLVYVVYTTGDSFNTYRGNIEHVQLFRNLSEANALAEAIADNARENKDILRGDYKYTIEYTIEGNPDMVQTSAWTGYFESVEDVIVQPVVFGGQSFM